MARCLVTGVSVLCHCSDGWDRTAQVCAISQLLLDPFFRSLRGFAVLIEKDWLSFGHKFQDRCGHGTPLGALSPSADQERSPIFVQWLDVVHQLLIQFPTDFGFSEALLVFLADHVNSCLFGSFLGNCERERARIKTSELTRSIWDYVFSHEAQFANPHYQSRSDPLFPSLSPKRMVLWERYFCRWDGTAHPYPVDVVEGRPDTAWRDNWGDGTTLDSSSSSKLPEKQDDAAGEEERRMKLRQCLVTLLERQEKEGIEALLDELEGKEGVVPSLLAALQPNDNVKTMNGSDDRVVASLTVNGTTKPGETLQAVITEGGGSGGGGDDAESTESALKSQSSHARTSAASLDDLLNVDVTVAAQKLWAAQDVSKADASHESSPASSLKQTSEPTLEQRASLPNPDMDPLAGLRFSSD